MLLAAALALATSATTVAVTAGSAAAAGDVRATVRSGGGWLNTRSGPGSGYARTGRVANRATVTITCQSAGTRTSGDVRTSNQWDRLTTGQYVSHAYIQTSASIAGCAGAGAGAGAGGAPGGLAVVAAPGGGTGQGTVRSGGGWLNVRTGPGSSYPLAGRLATNTAVTIACQSAGLWVSGDVRTSNQWDRLSNGRYVSHAYIQTSASIAACTGTGAVPAGTSVAGPTPGASTAEFIAASVGPARQGFRDFRVPASVTIAQAILESGWGSSALATNDRNFFGIKCFPGNIGPYATGCHSYVVSECTPTCHPTGASFRVYATSGDSYRDHGNFLASNSRYQAAFGYSGNPNAFVDQIWRAGYATSPVYVAQVQALMRQFNLYQYDLAP